MPTAHSISEHDQSALSGAFGIPTSSWSSQYWKATGFFLTQQARQTGGDIKHYNTSFRFLIKNVLTDDLRPPELRNSVSYGWTEIGLWTQWIPSHSSVLLCSIREPTGTKLWDNLCLTLQGDVSTLKVTDPFAWHSHVLPVVTKAFDGAVWSCRDRIRRLEQNRADVHSGWLNYPSMHEMARHTIHVTETINMAITVVENIMQERQSFHRPGNHDMQSISVQDLELDQGLRCQKTLLQCAKGRSQALALRIQNEINLVSCSCSRCTKLI